MGTLYLVRHGQASFGAANYDQLSPLGERQSQLLGQHFKRHGVTFSSALTGTLKRHTQTYTGICDGMGTALSALALPGLNEYLPEAVIAAIHPQPLAKPDTPETYRQHFRLLRDGLSAWMAGTVQPAGMLTYAEFTQGISHALAHVRNQCDGNVLLASSGGPIACAVAQVLGCGPEATIELNFRLRNSAVTELVFNPKRLHLLTFNTLPHLQDRPDWVTFT
ncbi:MAG: histidine phosphatase family protein [Burkholderiales bacterium]